MKKRGKGEWVKGNRNQNALSFYPLALSSSLFSYLRVSVFICGF
jgi:hypothetical protein